MKYFNKVQDYRHTLNKAGQAQTHKGTGMAFDYDMQLQDAKQMYPEKEQTNMTQIWN